MTVQGPITRGEAAWLLVPGLLVLGMFIPLPGVDAAYLEEVLDGSRGTLLSVFTVTAYAMTIVWGIGTGRIVLRRYRLRTKSR
jgi:hypothetical protein